MFNKVMAKLNGSGAEPAALQAALADNDRLKVATRERLDELGRRRHQALLDDADDATIDAIERDIDRASVQLEKLNAAEAPLRERLAAAKGEALAAAVARHFDAISDRYKKLRTKVLEADAAQRELMRARDEAVGEVGEGAVLRAIPIFAFGGFLGHGLAEIWAQESDRVLASARTSREGRRAKRQPAPVVVKSAPPPTSTAPQPARLVLTAPRPPDDWGPLEPGQVRCRITRSGYEIIPGVPSPVGHVARQERATARRAQENGALEIIEESPQ